MRKHVFSIMLLATAVVLGGASCISFGDDTTGTTGPAGIFISTDKGDNWTHRSQLPEADGVKTLSGVSVFRVAQDPQDVRALYWSSREHGLFYSYDDGINWRHSVPPFNAGFVYSVAVHPKDKCTVYATNGASLYRSDDCSRSWTQIYFELQSADRLNVLAFNPFPPYQLYAAKTSGDLLQSQDGGVSWSIVRRFGVRIEDVIFDPLQDGVMYFATRDQGLFRSRAHADRWETMINALSSYTGALEYRRFILHPTKKNVVYWISTYGILVSDNGGEAWKPLNLITPPGTASIYAFAINPKNDQEMYYTATINDRSTLYVTTDGGKNWITKKLPSGQTPTYLRVHPLNENTLYLGFTIPPKE